MGRKRQRKQEVVVDGNIAIGAGSHPRERRVPAVWFKRRCQATVGKTCAAELDEDVSDKASVRTEATCPTSSRRNALEVMTNDMSESPLRSPEEMVMEEKAGGASEMNECWDNDVFSTNCVGYPAPSQLSKHGKTSTSGLCYLIMKDLRRPEFALVTLDTLVFVATRKVRALLCLIPLLVILEVAKLALPWWSYLTHTSNYFKLKAATYELQHRANRESRNGFTSRSRLAAARVLVPRVASYGTEKYKKVSSAINEHQKKSFANSLRGSQR